MIRHANIYIFKMRRRLNILTNILFRLYCTFLHVAYLGKFEGIEIQRKKI